MIMLKRRSRRDEDDGQGNDVDDSL